MLTEIEVVKASIFNYLSHLHDGDYMAASTNSMPLSEFYNILSILLQSEDNETVGLTTLFVTDLVMAGFEHPDCAAFREQYPNSLVVKTLEKMVFSTEHYICTVAVYTLGKTGSYNSVDTINRAFFRLRDVAPLALPRIMGEMGWLGAENFWELLDSMMSSPVYVTRWAVLDVLQEFIGNDAREEDQLYQSKLRCVKQLRQDLNIYVRLEAEYEYQLLIFRCESHELSKVERRKKRKDRIRQYKPVHCFAEISVKFINDLHQHSQISCRSPGARRLYGDRLLARTGDRKTRKILQSATLDLLLYKINCIEASN